MSNLQSIFPANDFKVVLESAKSETTMGIVVGLDEAGELNVFGGGLINGRQPTNRDWLWLIESFKQALMNGEYDA